MASYMEYYSILVFILLGFLKCVTIYLLSITLILYSRLHTCPELDGRDTFIPYQSKPGTGDMQGADVPGDQLGTRGYMLGAGDPMGQHWTSLNLLLRGLFQTEVPLPSALCRLKPKSNLSERKTM